MELRDRASVEDDGHPVDIFLHVPKTGGSTLVEILHRQYADVGYVWVRPGTSFGDARRQVVEAQGTRFALVHGHVPFGIHESLTRRARYFTLLRDPVDRAISHYFFAKSHPEHRLYKEIAEKGMTLHDYVTSGVTGELANGQTAMLAGLERDAPSGDSSLLRQARENIETAFAAVGVTEDFDRTIVLFKLKLGWKRSLVYKSINVTAARPSAAAVEPKTIDAIRAQNELDDALYRFVRERLDMEVEDAKMAANRELRRLRVGKALYRYRPKSVVRRGWVLMHGVLAPGRPARTSSPR